MEGIQAAFSLDVRVGDPGGGLESARVPRTTVQTPFVWGEDESWKDAYARVDREQAERLRQAGEERRSRQQRAKSEGRARTS